MKAFLCWIALSGALLTLPAQQPDFNAFQSRNAFFLELGGRAWMYSLNYERRFIMSNKLKVGVQIGFGKLLGTLSVDPDTLSGDMMVPISINGQYGTGAHHLEVGLGSTLKFFDGFSSGKYIYPTIDGKILLMGTLQAGYRYHPPIDGLLIRLNYTGIYQYLNGHPAAGPPLSHWFGVSIGIALKNANVR